MELITKKGVIILDDESPYAEFKWNINHRGYAKRHVSIGGKRVTVFLHRVVANAKPKEIVDHINRNPLDNRSENLRIVTHKINSVNRGPNKIASSKFKGVTKHESGWQAVANGKYVGLFKTELEAALAYDKAAVQFFQHLAVTNQDLGLYEGQL